MKTLSVAISALLLAGCESSRMDIPITADQAEAIAVTLANEKAEALYHRQPFKDDQPAEFENGRWIWKSSRGVGTLEYQATVQVAANGETNSVEIQLTDDALHPQMVVPNGDPGKQSLPLYFQK